MKDSIENRMERNLRMKTFYSWKFTFGSLLLPALAMAGGPGEPGGADGMKVSAVIPAATITHYAATPKGGRPCRHECIPGRGCVGGPDASPSGIKPLSATIDKPGTIRGKAAVLTAVPQKGGNASMFGCFFAIPNAYPGKLFFAGDRYGPDSNGKTKTDVSSQCDSPNPWYSGKKGESKYRVNTSRYKEKIVVYDCPGIKGIARDISRKKPKKVPESVAKAPAADEGSDDISTPSSPPSAVPEMSAPPRKQAKSPKRAPPAKRAPASRPAAPANWSDDFWERHRQNGG